MNKYIHRFNTAANSNQGLTLVEVMMTLLIFGVVLGVVSNVFFTTQGLYGRTSQRAGQQMSSRSGVTVMVEELRRAGADPEATGLVGLVSAKQDTIRVMAEINDVAGIQTAEPSEDVKYFWDAGAMTVFRDSGSGPQAMITNVSNFQLTYFNAANTIIPQPISAALAATVASVEINLVTTTKRGGDVAVTTRVGLRNNS